MTTKKGSGRKLAKKACKHCGDFNRYLSGPCVTCTVRRAAVWRTANPERARIADGAWSKANPAKVAAAARAYRIDNPASIMVDGAKRRAKLGGLPFDITASDVSIPEFCPVLGIRLERSTAGVHGPGPSSPSLDRIVPVLGYVRGNVRVISWRANNLRRDGSAEELMRVALDAAALAAA